jgi:hypothetical protein
VFYEVTTVHGRAGDCIHTPRQEARVPSYVSGLAGRAHARHNFKVGWRFKVATGLGFVSFAAHCSTTVPRTQKHLTGSHRCK